MPLQFPDPGSPLWFRQAEQLAEQHHIDIQRLWQVTTQVPDPQIGMPFIGPTAPTYFFLPPSLASSSSSSSGP